MRKRFFPGRAAARMLVLCIGVLIGGCGGTPAFWLEHDASARTNPTASKPISISISPSEARMALGASQRLKATATYSDGTTRDVSTLAAWRAANPVVVSIANSTGIEVIATASEIGTTTITAAFMGVSENISLNVTAATLVRVSLTPANPAVLEGTIRQMRATGIYSDQATQDLTGAATWTVSDPNIATVSNAAGSKGRTEALLHGSTIVTATIGALSGSTQLNVTAAALVSIEITPSARTVANGQSIQFMATGVFSNQSTQDLTELVLWTSSRSSVAAIGNAPQKHGVATASMAGTTQISASLSNVVGSTTLNVTDAALTSIVITPTTTSISQGLTIHFTATGAYSDKTTRDLTESVVWSSSDANIITISNAAASRGVAIAASPGTTTVSATLDGVHSRGVSLQVTVPVIVSILVTPAGDSVAAGAAQQFVGRFVYSDNSTTDATMQLTWSTSSNSVATISNAPPVGRATGVSPGTVTITASAPGVPAGSTTLVVTAATLVSIAVTPANSSTSNGTQKQFSALGIYTDNSMRDLTASATWSSSNTAVATISNSGGSKGLATSASVGATSITASLGSVTSAAGMFTVTSGQAYAYVLNQDDDTVSYYRIDSGGTLTPIATAATGDAPASIAIDPLNHYAYIVNQNANTLSQYTIDAAGSLTAIGTVNAGAVPVSCAVDPSGRYVYVANFADNTLTVYQIGTGGILTMIGTVNTATAPISLTVDPFGRYLYVTGFVVNTVSQYAIGTGGTLTSLGTASTGDRPIAVASDPAGRFLYVANFASGTVSEFSIGSYGRLSPLVTAAAGGGAASVVVEPTGHFVYVANYLDSTISEFTIGSGGALTLLGTLPSGANPESISADRSGRYVYVANSSDGTVSQYAINTDGSLSSMADTATGAYPVSVVTWN